jgi:hypothetical protein
VKFCGSVAKFSEASRPAEQRVLLAVHLLELRHQLLGHLAVGPGADRVDDPQQQRDQRVGDLPGAAVDQGGQQGSRSLSPSPASALTSASSRALTSPGSRPETRETRIFSAWRSPEWTIRSTRSGVGGSSDRERSSARSASLVSS